MTPLLGSLRLGNPQPQPPSGLSNPGPGDHHTVFNTTRSGRPQPRATPAPDSPGLGDPQPRVTLDSRRSSGPGNTVPGDSKVQVTLSPEDPEASEHLASHPGGPRTMAARSSAPPAPSQGRRAPAEAHGGAVDRPGPTHHSCRRPPWRRRPAPVPETAADLPQPESCQTPARLRPAPIPGAPPPAPRPHCPARACARASRGPAPGTRSRPFSSPPPPRIARVRGRPLSPAPELQPGVYGRLFSLRLRTRGTGGSAYYVTPP